MQWNVYDKLIDPAIFPVLFFLLSFYLERSADPDHKVHPGKLRTVALTCLTIALIKYAIAWWSEIKQAWQASPLLTGIAAFCIIGGWVLIPARTGFKLNKERESQQIQDHS